MENCRISMRKRTRTEFLEVIKLIFNESSIKEIKEKLLEEIATSHPFRIVDVDSKKVVTCNDIQNVLKLSNKMFLV